MRDLPTLLNTLDPQASLVERHLWLMDLMQWVRGERQSVEGALERLRLMLDALQAQPDKAMRLRRWWSAMRQSLDLAALLAEFGFSSRSAFVSELAERLRRKLLPATPETADAAELFALVFNDALDVRWLQAIDAPLMARITAALHSAEDAQAAGASGIPDWPGTVMEAITLCTSQVRATGFAPELRLRMSAQARQAAPFHALAADADQLRDCVRARDAGGAEALDAALLQFRNRLEACRAAAASVYAHLDEHGVSVGLVFRIRQLRERILRIRALIDCLAERPIGPGLARLLGHLAQVGRERRSVRVLVASNASLLAAKLTERSSEVGEHYITRDRAEYRTMLRQAAGGGALTAVTTLAKFGVMAVGLSAFWNGFWSGVVYAASFVVIQLLHFTLATKQPAMTAPAMAARLKDLEGPAALEAFVDEVVHLVRSQAAAVVGNVGIVVPAVLLLAWLVRLLKGAPLLDAPGTAYVLHSLTLLGPSLLFAAVTGVLLFASSIIAGWVENGFVFYRMDSALRYNPAITRRLGSARADRWASFLRQQISGFASNISLGFMLGLVPAIAAFLGIGLELRHVTLSAGQLAAAGASMGWSVLREPGLWWCVACIPLIGLLNLGVSFYCAFRLALLSHSVGALDRSRISQAIMARLRAQPLQFIWPGREMADPHPPAA